MSTPPAWLLLGSGRMTAVDKVMIGDTSVRCGCAAGAERCEIHHIVPWQHGGLTNTDDMCLVCPMCHHNIHDHGYIVIKTNTGYKIINPNNPPPDYTGP